MKRTNNNLILINCIFVTCLLITNVIAAKVTDTGLTLFGYPVIVTGAIIIYGFTYLCTDVISEIWGKEEATKAVWRGFIAQGIALAFIISTQYLPALDDGVQSAYETLLGQSPMCVFASLVSYLCAQHIDVWLFHKVRKHFNGEPSKRWMWNCCTVVSQFVDSTIWIGIACGIGFGWFFSEGGFNLMIGMFIGEYCCKFIIALLDTPFFYFATRKQKQTSN